MNKAKSGPRHAAIVTLRKAFYIKNSFSVYRPFKRA